jgi:hypothetical protein
LLLAKGAHGYAGNGLNSSTSPAKNSFTSLTSSLRQGVMQHSLFTVAAPLVGKNVAFFLESCCLEDKGRAIDGTASYLVFRVLGSIVSNSKVSDEAEQCAGTF